MHIININNKYDYIEENSLFKTKMGRVVVTKVAYPAAAAGSV